MGAPPIEIRRAPCGPIGQAWGARVEDWIDGGDRIIRLSREYRRHYRATICAKCTPERQAKRRCAALSEGCDTLSCSHMNRAFYSRYRKVIRARLASHPLAERIRLNARLEEARRGREDGPAGQARPDMEAALGRFAPQGPQPGLKPRACQEAQA